jgi:hypothetical protein
MSAVSGVAEGEREGGRSNRELRRAILADSYGINLVRPTLHVTLDITALVITLELRFSGG